MLLRDRAHAGASLAAALKDAGLPDPVILGLPRGGVPVAFRIARALEAPLDVIVIRKLGVPHHPELAMGAVGEDGVRVVDDEVVTHEEVRERELLAVEARERRKVAEQARVFRGGRPLAKLTGRTVVLVDDGIATGSTMLAACQVARAHNPLGLVVAVPVAPREALGRLRDVADDVVCLHTPHPFMAVGLWYHDFTQVTDAEVALLLQQA
jgi:putative phosphoribosyl transferase